MEKSQLDEFKFKFLISFSFILDCLYLQGHLSMVPNEYLQVFYNEQPDY